MDRIDRISSFSLPGRNLLLIVFALFLWAGKGVGQSPEDRNAIANRLEEEGIVAWQEGRHEEGAERIEAAIERDPTDPRRALKYGSLLMVRGQQLLQEGNTEAAALTLEESEIQLTAAVRLAEGMSGYRPVAGEGFFLLGEIAYYARKNEERAIKFYQSAARRLPGDQRVVQALARLGADPDPPIDPEPIPRVEIGVANSVVIEDHRLRLVNEDSNQRIAVKEYLPLGETMENWSVLFARREHRQFASPRTFADLLARKAADQGCRILKTSSGPGDAASVAFVIHSPRSRLSEVNVWNLYVEGGTLISEQFARRVRGDHHMRKADSIGAGKASDWISALQARRRIGESRSNAIAEAAP